MNIKTKFNIGKLFTIYIPILCAILMVVHSIFDFYEIYLRIFSYLGGTSVLIWIYLLWNSYMYNLCIYQRMFTYYLIFGSTISIIDNYIHLPISDMNYLLVYCISFGITVLLYGYFKFIENKRKNTIKVKLIKKL